MLIEGDLLIAFLKMRSEGRGCGMCWGNRFEEGEDGK